MVLPCVSTRLVSPKIGVGVKDGVGVNVGDGDGVDVAPGDDVGVVVAVAGAVADSWGADALSPAESKTSAASSVWRCRASAVLMGGPSNDPVAGVARVTDADACGSLPLASPDPGDTRVVVGNAVIAESLTCVVAVPTVWSPMGTPATKKPKDNNKKAKAKVVKVRTRMSRRALLKPDRRKS